MITINDVRSGVVGVLTGQFPGVQVLTEESADPLTEPAFFVKFLSSTQQQEIGRRYKRCHSFDIRYSGGANEDAVHGVAEQLYNCMEYILPTGGDKKCRGRDLRYEIIEGVLHFYVSYDFQVLLEDVTFARMQTLAAEGTIKS
ncbi:MAG TPA: hypothetical protein VFV52_00170 [Bacilli bacterium]|nr:hypothetical protein [Bacilli bacterium]